MDLRINCSLGQRLKRSVFAALPFISLEPIQQTVQRTWDIFYVRRFVGQLARLAGCLQPGEHSLQELRPDFAIVLGNGVQHGFLEIHTSSERKFYHNAKNSLSNCFLELGCYAGLQKFQLELRVLFGL